MSPGVDAGRVPCVRDCDGVSELVCPLCGVEGDVILVEEGDVILLT